MLNLNDTVPEPGVRAVVLMPSGAFTTGSMAGPLSNERHATLDAFLEGALLSLANRPGAITCLVVHGVLRKSLTIQVPYLLIRGT